MKRRAWSMWGYEVSCCQRCGVVSIVNPCRLCQPKPKP
jgi:hypothetical protein